MNIINNKQELGNSYFKISPNIWVITGPNGSKFPWGNALFITTTNYNILIDTNPGFERIKSFLKDGLSMCIEDITDIILTHAHLDHSKALGQIYNIASPMIHGSKDTLLRCKDSHLIGLYAGIPKEGIHHFVNYGLELGFLIHDYPKGKMKRIDAEKRMIFDSITIIPHITDAHAISAVDFEIIDNNKKFILSHDYDFTPIPWYGVPQRGHSIHDFIKQTKKIINRDSDLIISSHRCLPIERSLQKIEFDNYKRIISARTQKAVEILSNYRTLSLDEFPNFIYPINKMKGRYSEDYLYLGQIWDYWLLLSHLEAAWMDGIVECIDSGGDEFLSKCINSGKYREDLVYKMLMKNWAKATLEGNPPFEIPIKSCWKLIKK